jgi:hypothetical protein
MTESYSDPLTSLAGHFEHYLTLVRIVPGVTYNYAARGFFNLPVIEHRRYAPKCALGEEWTYVVAPVGADLRRLRPEQRLYVGAQTPDRMFRGDEARQENFHHAEMRRGRDRDNLESFLAAGGSVEVYRLPMHRLRCEPATHPVLRGLQNLPTSSRQHLGYWAEQLLLHRSGPWRWNVAMPSASTGERMRQAGLYG